MTRGRASLDIPDLSIPYLQSTLCETVGVTHAIANQVKFIGPFHVLAYLPHDATFPASDIAVLPLTDRFVISRESLITVQRLGLNQYNPEDAKSLRRVGHLKAAFVTIPDKLMPVPHHGLRCVPWTHGRDRCGD